MAILSPMPRDPIGENYKWRDWLQKIADSISGTAGSGVSHQSLSDIQGGTSTERYHLTQSEYVGTGTNDLVRETTPTIDSPLINKVDFTTGLSNPSYLAGRFFWDDDESALGIYTDVSNVLQHLGREWLLKVVNKTGTTIASGQVVYVNGAQGNRPTIALAKADAESTSANTAGITVASIANNAEGYICTLGILSGINTSGFSAGDVLFLSASTAGALTATSPTAPNHSVKIAHALNSTVNGRVYIHVDNGMETHELHDVSGTHPSITGQILVWDNTAGYYTPTTTAYGEMYATNITQTVTVAASGTFYEVTGGFTGGTVLRTTFGGNHYLQVTDAGKYRIDWSMTIDSASANDELEGGFMVNGTAQSNATAHSSVSAASEGEALAASGIVTLAANDQVSLCVRNMTGARDIVVEHGTLVIEKLLA